MDYMENRKVINGVARNEIVKHEGDLIVEGDVGECAQINLTEGALIIKGNVKEGARINLSLSEELRQSSSIKASFGSVSIGCISIRNGGSFSAGSYSYADIRINNKLAGNVNIDNRIFTDDQVEELGGGKFRITKQDSNGMFSFVSINGRKNKSPDGKIAAKIDGVNYAGKEIFVDKKEVWVDGILSTGIESKKSPSVPRETPKLLIEGNVEDVVVIASDAEIIVNGNIGKFCQISSEYDGLTAKNIDEETKIVVRNAIKVGNVSRLCNLTSHQYGLNADSLANNVNVKTRDQIEIYGDIGNNCKLVSQQYGLASLNIGAGVEITTRDEIKVKNVGDFTKLSSANYGVKGGAVGNNVHINARDQIELSSVGDNSRIESKNYGITVDADVGSHAVFIARDVISTGSVGNRANFTSQNDKIKIRGDVGQSCKLNAKDSIRARNVGASSEITSRNDEVELVNLENYVKVNARDNISIMGLCPTSCSLHSSSGKIKKFPQPKQPPQPAPSQSTPVLSEVKQTLFSPPAVTSSEKREVVIPEAFLCIITQDVMQNPSICLLDGKTYETAAITEWLTKHGTSPFNRAKMESGRSVESYLVPNRNLLDLIDEFFEEHPGLANRSTNTI